MRDNLAQELTEKLVSVNRVVKVVKGGRNFGFAAIVVVGDGKGMVGFGTGKAKEVIEARSKATKAARKSLVRIPLREGRTVHHDIQGNFGAGKVVIRTAPPGTGVIAGGAMRAVFEAVGIKDVVAKSLSTSNPYNLVKATFDGLQRTNSPKSLANMRGKKVSDIVNKRNSSGKDPVKAEDSKDGADKEKKEDKKQ
jgi:small subunit ribosomal protein S5